MARQARRPRACRASTSRWRVSGAFRRGARRRSSGLAAVQDARRSARSRRRSLARSRAGDFRATHGRSPRTSRWRARGTGAAPRRSPRPCAGAPSPRGRSAALGSTAFSSFTRRSARDRPATTFSGRFRSRCDVAGWLREGLRGDRPRGMDLRAHLLATLDRAYDGRSWHGPNLKRALRGLTPAVAFFRPGPERHSVYDLALHAAYWKYVVRRRLSGEKRGSFALPGSNFFLAPARSSPKEIDSARSLLEREHRALRALDRRGRDLGRSRARSLPRGTDPAASKTRGGKEPRVTRGEGHPARTAPVSYTHLTLPTNREV